MTDLDARIRKQIEWAYEDMHSFGHNALDALSAVLDVHKADVLNDCEACSYEIDTENCSHSSRWVDWPCPTVNAIARALYVDLED